MNDIKQHKLLQPYGILVNAENIGHTVEIRMRADHSVEGVADTTNDGNVRVYYGRDDGSDDCTITPAEFNDRFEVTAVICI